MSCGVMRIRASLSQAERQVAQGIHEKRIEKIDGQNDDHRRQVDAHLQRGQPMTDGSQHRLRDAVEKAHDRIERIGIHPGQHRARDDDPEVRLQHEMDQVGHGHQELAGQEHYAGPRPSSRERSVARSTARMNVVRMPPSSSAAMPAMVVPPGDDTMSLSAPGCRPVSDSSVAAPSTVCVASVMAVARSSPIFTPPSASDSITMATYAGPDPDRPVTASMWSSSSTTTLPTAAKISCAVSR